MRILPRTRFGNPILRTPSKMVPPAFLQTASFRQLVKEMFYTMHRVQGVGLAAPQVGHPIRLAVIHISSERADVKGQAPLRRVIVNPKILARSHASYLDWEGCLSFPEARGQARRSRTIRVRYINENGERVTETHRGFAARVFQHEIDHLNGVLYVDRMPDMRSLMTHDEFLKRI